MCFGRIQHTGQVSYTDSHTGDKLKEKCEEMSEVSSRQVYWVVQLTFTMLSGMYNNPEQT